MTLAPRAPTAMSAHRRVAAPRSASSLEREQAPERVWGRDKVVAAAAAVGAVLARGRERAGAKACPARGHVSTEEAYLR